MGFLDVLEYLSGTTFYSLQDVDCLGQNVFHHAVQGNQLVIVKHLAENVPDLLWDVDIYGRNVLHIAAQFGHLDLVQYLTMLNDTSSTSVDQDGFLPLHYAAWQGHLDIVKYFNDTLNMIDLPINSLTVEGLTTFQLAALNGHVEVMESLSKQKLILQKEKNGSVLYFTSLLGQKETIEFLVEKLHFNVQIKDSEGNTALHLASINGDSILVLM